MNDIKRMDRKSKTDEERRKKEDRRRKRYTDYSLLLLELSYKSYLVGR